jgi:hypothetical protein
MDALLILEPDYECLAYKGTEHEIYLPTNYRVQAIQGNLDSVIKPDVQGLLSWASQTPDQKQKMSV